MAGLVESVELCAYPGELMLLLCGRPFIIILRQIRLRNFVMNRWLELNRGTTLLCRILQTGEIMIVRKQCDSFAVSKITLIPFL